jgi:hypothetical protein
LGCTSATRKHIRNGSTVESTRGIIKVVASRFGIRLWELYMDLLTLGILLKTGAVSLEFY